MTNFPNGLIYKVSSNLLLAQDESGRWTNMDMAMWTKMNTFALWQILKIISYENEYNAIRMVEQEIEKWNKH